MTKQEIYVKLGYTGEYTKEVKKRFRELVKKYHPDLNNGDDTTMKLLNEVKNELENNLVDDIFYKSSIKSEKIVDVGEIVNIEDDYFKEVSYKELSKRIEELKLEKEVEYQKLLVIDKKLNNLYVSFKKKLNKYEEEKYKISELNLKRQNENNKKNIYLFLIFTEGFFIVFEIFYFNLYMILISIIFLGILIFLFYHKYLFLFNIKRNISIAYANKNTFFNDVMDSKIEIEKEEKKRFNQYIKFRSKADDMQLYYYELLKKNNNIVTYQKNTNIKL